jgi:hypothetical protein
MSRSARLSLSTAAFGLFCVSSWASIRWVIALWTYRNTGLDFSDESYYLLSARFPSAIVASVTDFGHFLNIIYIASGSTLGGFRMAGAIGGLCASAVCGLAVRTILPPTFVGRRPASIVAAIAVASSFFTFYSSWLVTPGYNLLSVWLVLVSVACILIGLERPRNLAIDLSASPSVFSKIVDRQFIFAGLLLGILAVVKTTSFLVASFIISVIVFGRLKGKATPAFVSSAVGGLFAGIVTVCLVGNPYAHFLLFRRGTRALKLMGGTNLRSVFEFSFVKAVVLPWGIRFFLLGAIAGLVTRRIRSRRVRETLAVFGSLASIGSMWESRPVGGSGGSGNGWWMLRLTLLALFWIAISAKDFNKKLLLGPLVVALAPAVTVGSNNGIFRMLSVCGAIFTFAVVIQTSAVIRQWGNELTLLTMFPAFLFLLATSMSSLLVLPAALRDPYRSPPLSELRVQTTLPGIGQVRLDGDSARYVDSLAALEKLLPVPVGDCFLDLTGGTPASALVLGMRPPNPWIPGAYAGSNELAQFLVDNFPCVSGKVVVLSSPDGERRIALPRQLLNRRSQEIGRVRFVGYISETQVLSIYW